MVDIALQDITLDNFRDAVKLKVAESQAGFVASNLESLAWSRYIPNLMPKGIYDGDIMVGFALYGSWGDERPGMWGIARIMVGEQYQGKGYGRASMQEIIRQIKEQAPSTRGVVLSYVPENKVGRKLYASLGFKETGELMDHEVVAQYDYPPEKDEKSSAPKQASMKEAKPVPSITLHELTMDNWREAARLDVEEDQRGFVAPNVWSIAFSKMLPEWIPSPIYNDDTMVGFAFYGERAPQTWHIMRFMIDKRYQGKGYGKAAMREIIRTIREKAPDCHTIDLSYAPENDVARNVYASVGFKETGEVHGEGDESEVVAALDLKDSSDTKKGADKD